MPFSVRERAINSIRLAIAGAGRMGQSIAALAGSTPDLEVAGIWRRGEDLDRLLQHADVLIDFSLPEATNTILTAATARGIPLVCGVSGLPDAAMRRLESAAVNIPIVYDRNMSLGIAVLQRSVRRAAAALGSGFNVVINEVHHVHKKDAPSGTALKLGEAIADALGESAEETIRYESGRRGEVPGDHEVILSSDTEQLRFRHSVTTRDVFAAGAIRSARWIIGQSAGLYSMQEVLFDQKSR